MDFKGFKKIEETKDHAKMQHEKGHILVIAKKGLTPKVLLMLEKLPAHKADGGYINSSNQSAAMKENYGSKKKKVRYMADGGDTDTGATDQTGVPYQDTTDPDTGLPTQTNQQPASVSPELPDTSTQSSAPQDTSVQNSGDQTQYPSSSMPDQQSIDGTTGQAAPMQTAIQQATQAQLADEDSKWGQDLNDGHITPKTYASLFQDKGTLGKIGTLFGLALSGAGSGLAHQQNAAMEMMNNVIKNDLTAQTQSKANAQNFLKLAQAHTLQNAQIDLYHKQGLLNDAQAKEAKVNADTKAYALANMAANRAALDHMRQQIDAMPEGPQKQQALKSLGIMFQGVNNENYSIGSRAAAATALGGSFTNGQQSGDPEANFAATQQQLIVGGFPQIAADNQARHMPGVGDAAVPLTANDRDSIIAGKTFLQQMGRLQQWVDKNGGSVDPRIVKEGQAMAADAQQAYRTAINGGIYRAGEQKFISGIINSDPSAFLHSFRTDPGLRAVTNDMGHQYNNLLQSKGLPAQQQQQSPTTTGPKFQEGSVYTDKNGNKATYTNGQFVPLKQ